ncbi:hypothetical protein AgCh_028713 [Apium graveolens]
MGESLGWSGDCAKLLVGFHSATTILKCLCHYIGYDLSIDHKAELDQELTELKALEIKSAQFEKENEGLVEVNLKFTQELSVCESRPNDLQAKLSATSLEKVEAVEQLQCSQIVLEELKIQQISDGEKLQSQISLLLEEKNLLTGSHENAKELETVI